MKFTLVKSARKGSTVMRALEGTAESMTLAATESVSQMDHVWSLLNMAVDDKTKKALEDELEIEDILDL